MNANVQVMTGTQAATESPLDALLQRPHFSAEAFHAMSARDNMQIEQEILHGVAEAEFVYAMVTQGKLVTGVSVVGARQLATEYGAMKSRLIASTEKRGALFVFRQFAPLMIETRTLQALADEPDYYEAVIEVTDLKTGNSIEIRKSEVAIGNKRDGGTFDRPHFATIAESKAFRNGVLALIPQGVIKAFKLKCLKRAMEVGAFNAPEQSQVRAAVIRYLQAPNQPPAGAEKTVDQLREGALAFATKFGLGLDRMKLAGMTYAELYGLGQAAAGGKESYVQAVTDLGLVLQRQEGERGPGRPPGSKNKPKDAPTRSVTSEAPQQSDENAAQTVTYAEVSDALQKAKTEDEVAAARDLIRSVADSDQRTELEAIALESLHRVLGDVPV